MAGLAGFLIRGRALVRLVGAAVQERQRLAGLTAGEIDEHVRALSGSEQDLGPDRGGRGQKPAVASDLVERDLLVEAKSQGPRLAAVEQAEAVEPRLDLQIRPHATVDHHRVAEHLGVPERVHRRFGVVGPLEAIEVFAAVRVAERAVAQERPVLNRDGDLEVAHPRRVTDLGSRPGQTERVFDAVAQEIETREAGVHVQPGHSQRVVVEPEGAGALVVRVLEQRRTRPDVFRRAEVRPLADVPRRDVIGVG